METANTLTYRTIMHNTHLGKFVAICNGTVLGYFDNMLEAARFVRIEIRKQKHSICVFHLLDD